MTNLTRKKGHLSMFKENRVRELWRLAPKLRLEDKFICNLGFVHKNASFFECNDAGSASFSPVTHFIDSGNKQEMMKIIHFADRSREVCLHTRTAEQQAWKTTPDGLQDLKVKVYVPRNYSRWICSKTSMVLAHLIFHVSIFDEFYVMRINQCLYMDKSLN